MKRDKKFEDFSLKALTKEIAEKYATELAALADLIPQVSYSEKEIVAEAKGDRVFLANGIIA